MILFRIAVGAFAVLLMLVGLILAPSPIPLGIIIFLIGFFLLVSVAPAFVRSVRKRWRWFDRQIHHLENVLPEWMAEPLRASDYVHDDESVDDESDNQLERKR